MIRWFCLWWLGVGQEKERERKSLVSIKNFAKQSITSLKLTHMGIQSFFVWFMYSCITLQRIRTIVLSRRRLLAHHHLVVIVFRNHLLGGRCGQMRISCIIIDRTVTCKSPRHALDETEGGDELIRTYRHGSTGHIRMKADARRTGDAERWDFLNCQQLPTFSFDKASLGS